MSYNKLRSFNIAYFAVRNFRVGCRFKIVFSTCCMPVTTLRLLFFLATTAGLLGGCSVLNKIPKTQFANGYYTLGQRPGNPLVYVDITDTSLQLHSATGSGAGKVLDTLPASRSDSVAANSYGLHFRRQTFDLDVLTIPFKFRLPAAGVPVQLNANLNGAAYIGYRTDHYVVSYTTDPLGKAVRTINHFGFSGGLFTGIGSTDMTPTNTANRIGDEYDGIVWSKGIAGIIAVNNVTVGITAGFDYLIDKNRHVWIYQSKPWFGLAFGLNLN